jgi:uncharacterized damage-inducible protein DinB
MVVLRTIADFERLWAFESAQTLNVLKAVTDAAMSQAVADGHRTLARLGWHIACTIPEMFSRTGLNFTRLDPEAPLPKTAREISDTYAAAAAELLELVKTNWTDQSLLEEHEMYDDLWPNGLTLLILVKHEIHHRGQMSVLLRQAGLKVPSIYGPAYEGWAEYGGTPPEV